MKSVDDSALPFFRKIDWFSFWSAFVVALGVYSYTLAPSVTLEDGGELAVAGDWLGVPHPPGYPSWTILAWLFARVFSFVTFRGQPNPTWGIGFMSAFFGALSAGLAALLICRSGRDLLSRSGLVSHNMSMRTESLICWAAGFASSLLFAFTPIMWSQSVIVEVYSLNAFFLILVMLLIYMWICRPSDKLLFWAAFMFGVGLTNYQVLLLAALALAIVVMFNDFELFRDFAVVGGPIVAVVVLLSMGILPPIKHPTDPSWYIYLGLNGILLVLAYYFLPRGKTVAITILLAELGIAVYAYMPIVSDLRNPPMNWGYPRTWEGFKHAISRGQYERITPADMFSLRYLQQIGTYLSDLRLNFTLFVALIAFLPFCSWRWKLNREGKVFDAMKWGLVMIVAAVVLLPLGGLQPLYKLPSLVIFLLLAIGATAMTVLRFQKLLEVHVENRAVSWEKITAIAVLVVMGLAWLGLVGRKFFALIGGDVQTEHFVVELMMIPVLILAPVLVIWLTRRFLLQSPQFELTVAPEFQKWMVSTLIAFVTLSLGLIALANLKMDIQDTFIQRVKFISSHLLFSFWIGYGLVFMLAFLDRYSSRLPQLTQVLVLAVALLPGIPILANAYNEHLIHIYGGADQHQRDFGWQFGNYQLRGAPAILEELAPDEEPLPNPAFPPPMEQDAIFYGGTDPGRFVPTYMIYSADVRPDVYLITQNALADGTYMSVMRDLYGNDIWIPSVIDSANAFSTFVNEVESGKRPPMPGIVKMDGRVQITGVMGVMEINGILAKDIFDMNQQHAFYVEESYVIRWMYPYLTPHGLIMKINRDPLPRLTDEVVTDDLDFWDWYTRRFLQHPMFPRDVVARKSFSKLRSAIAGLYAYRGMVEESEQAFSEALALYPLSPEANFRLAELYLRSGRFDKARDLMTAFQELDPANERVDGFLQQIENAETTTQRIREMEQRLQSNQLDAQGMLTLADLYRQTGNMGQFLQLTGGLLNSPDVPSFMLLPLAQLYQQAGRQSEMLRALDLCMERLPADAPPEVVLDVARLYRATGRAERIEGALRVYLDKRPQDWRAWLDLASLQAGRNDQEGASSAIGVAIRYGGQEAQQAILTNPQLAPIMQQRANRRQGVLGIGL